VAAVALEADGAAFGVTTGGAGAASVTCCVLVVTTPAPCR
jgi:hypothetical protein